MKNIQLLVLCIFLLMGCTNSTKPYNSNLKNDTTTLDTISYMPETTLTKNILGDKKDEYPVYEYELSQLLKSAIIQVWEKENKWENIITSYQDNIYSKGQIAIVLNDKSYDIHLIHSKAEREVINYYFSKHYLLKSSNSTETMFANTLNHKKINTDEEIVLLSTFGNKDDNSIDLKDYSDFREIDCDYGIVITITFYNTNQAPRIK